MSLLTCPNCDSPEVTVTYMQRVMVNTEEHYCHSLKTHDSDSNAECLVCGWNGYRKDLKGNEA